MLKSSCLFLLAGLLIVINACVFKDLKKELRAFDATYVIAGKVADSEAAEGPIIVILVNHSNHREEIRQIVFTEATGDFSFLVTEGNYSLAAFDDANSNMTYDKGEYAGYCGRPGQIVISPGMAGEPSASRDVKGLAIRLTPSSHLLKTIPELADTSLFGSKSLVRLGTIARLDDAIFAQDNGSLGYWKPATFLKNLGFGIYFLEPYDARKIPVLFVHGAVGTPIGFAPIAEAMDRHSFQPWFFYYPSGVRLESVSDALSEIVTRLHERYRFSTMILMAHSMGGLVSRGFINKYHQIINPADIRLFVSVSTPWGGSRMAAKGAENAPVAIPSWHDMGPDSEFIQNLYATPLPAMLSHHLFFGFKGDCSLFMANNDGTVELESQLDYRAQLSARAVIGLDEDHMSILESHQLIDGFNRILDQAARVQVK